MFRSFVIIVLSCRCVSTPSFTPPGPVFTRYGVPSCPTPHSLLYAGLAYGTPRVLASDGAVMKNGGVSTHCFGESSNVLYFTNIDPANASAYVDMLKYGGFFVMDAPWRQALSGQRVHCAVCARHSNRTTAVAIPGRRSCPPWLSLDHAGYLAGGAPSWHLMSEYVCLDRGPASTDNDTSPTTSASVTRVEVQNLSGAMVEAGYGATVDVSCAVCSGS